MQSHERQSNDNCKVLTRINCVLVFTYFGGLGSIVIRDHICSSSPQASEDAAKLWLALTLFVVPTALCTGITGLWVSHRWGEKLLCRSSRRTAVLALLCGVSFGSMLLSIVRIAGGSATLIFLACLTTAAWTVIPLKLKQQGRL